MRENVVICAFLALGLAAGVSAQEPRPVRHDVADHGTEFLVLRHQKLKPGTHDVYLRASQDAVWPFFEKLGNRNVGQWQVMFPAGGKPEGYDEGYRLARYRNFNHWVATRRTVELGGNGPDWEAAREALAVRQGVTIGSDGAIFLEGEMAPGTPYYFPALREQYRATNSASSVHPVRHERYKPGAEIVTLRRFKIHKGTYGQFRHLSQSAVWPYFEKMGVRIVGQWQRVYPLPGQLPNVEPSSLTKENAEFDEAFMMARYASYDHWRASRPNRMTKLGGDGPAYGLCVEGLERRGALTLDTSVRFLQGHWRGNPPIHSPGLQERYELVEDKP